MEKNGAKNNLMSDISYKRKRKFNFFFFFGGGGGGVRKALPMLGFEELDFGSEERKLEGPLLAKET